MQDADTTTGMVEEFNASFAAVDVVAANETAWAKLKAYLGRDDVAKWALVETHHTVKVGDDGQETMVTSVKFRRDLSDAS